MAERPILFSAPMVRAILAGTKTQTRRILRPDGKYRLDLVAPADGGPSRCPYGKPGDRLWVRETWAEVSRAEPRTDEDLPWREDGRILVYQADPQWEGARLFLCADGVMRWAMPDRWRPSIHMPRWASRISLEITGVRVERLQDISEADAQAEGCPCYVCGRTMDGHSESDCHCFHRKASSSDYRALWETINGPGSWDANPWVWVVEFRLLPEAAGGEHG